MGFNLFLTIDLNLLTLGSLYKFLFVAYTKHRCPKKKNRVLVQKKQYCSLFRLIIWYKARTVKLKSLIDWFALRICGALRMHNAPILQILCAPHSEQIEIFFPHPIDRTQEPVLLSNVISYLSQYARYSTGKNQRQGPVTEGLLPTLSMRFDSVSTNCP